MSEEQSTVENPATPAVQPNPAPATPAPVAPVHNGPGPGAQLLDAINALPERIVNSLREAAPKAPAAPPKAPPSTGDSAQATTTTTPAKATPPPHKEPGKKSFADWWFNG